MALKIETSYTNKDGEEKKFKYALIRVLGKNMDDGEIHKFQVLKGVERKRNTKFDYFTMFVKKPDTDICYILEFGTQLKGALDSLNIQSRDIIVLTKGSQNMASTGKTQEVVNVEVENRTNKATSDKPTDEEMTNFIEAYKNKVQPSDWNINHFIGSYVRTFSADKVEYLVKIYKDKVE